MDEEKLKKVDEWVKQSGAKSRNQFVSQALDFYISYLASKDATALLAPAITKVIDARLKRFEKNLSTGLFNMAVEQDMVNGLLANVYNLNEEYLLELRSEAIYNVKKTNGQLSLEQHAEKKMRMTNGKADRQERIHKTRRQQKRRRVPELYRYPRAC